MAPTIVVAVPVLNRPQNAYQVARSLAETSRGVARLLFVCSPGDDGEIAACHATGAQVLVAEWPAGKADWARKLELARSETDEPFMLLGGDDVTFHPGWADAVLAVFAEYDVGLVGTNDLANPRVMSGAHSTHPVICRGYADAHGTIDDPALMLHAGYHHNFVDTELVETAKARGCWAFSPAAMVEHSHPVWRTAATDDTYRLGQARYREDNALFNKRRRLWTH